jgi:hypothetical protein
MSEVMEARSLPEPATAVAVANKPFDAFAPGQIKALVERIQQDARAQAATLDISTPARRKAIASLAHKIARSKTAIDDAGKQLNEAKRAEIAVVDADRRFARDTLDELKNEIRKPLTDWEKADEDRVTAHKAALAEIEAMVPGLPAGASTEHISGLLASLRTNQPRQWQEFTVPAERAIAEAVKSLQTAWDQAHERECNAAAERQRKAEEAERKKQEAAQAQKEREARIAADAKREAEERAAEAVAAREAAEARLAEVQAQAEADRAAAAERERISAERDEINRQAALAKTGREQADATEPQQPADYKTVVKAAVDALIAAGLSRGAALTAIKAIASGSIPNVVLNY